MSLICSHYYANPFRNQFPDKEEINKYRLYWCDECKKWFSFLEEEYWR